MMEKWRVLREFIIDFGGRGALISYFILSKIVGLLSHTFVEKSPLTVHLTKHGGFPSHRTDWLNASESFTTLKIELTNAKELLAFFDDF